MSDYNVTRSAATQVTDRFSRMLRDLEDDFEEEYDLHVLQTRKRRRITMGDLCPSCREPLDCPSGDGCAAMTKHTEGLTMTDEVGHMKVTNLTEHEDGGATIEFDMDDTTAALAQELGLKLLIYCGATGTDLDCVFDNILGREEDNE